MLALDTTALVARFIAGSGRDVVLAAMAGDDDWCASALARAEGLAVIDRATEDPFEQRALRQALLDDWERVHMVPVDSLCLDRAAELARTQPLRIADAIHLAAAERLPRPLTYCTLDPRQIPVALALGFNVTST